MDSEICIKKKLEALGLLKLINQINNHTEGIKNTLDTSKCFVLFCFWKGNEQITDAMQIIPGVHYGTFWKMGNGIAFALMTHNTNNAVAVVVVRYARIALAGIIMTT